MRLTKDEKGMIESCFTYGMCALDNRYLAPIVARVGREMVVGELKRLDDAYQVTPNVYTDHEGCTYNSLVKK